MKLHEQCVKIVNFSCDFKQNWIFENFNLIEDCVHSVSFKMILKKILNKNS